MLRTKKTMNRAANDYGEYPVWGLSQGLPEADCQNDSRPAGESGVFGTQCLADLRQS